MKSFWRRAKPIGWGAFSVVLGFYFSPLSILVGYGLATHDLPLLWAKLWSPGLTFLMAMAGLLIAFVAFCVAVVAAIEAYQERRRLAPKFVYATLFCVVYVAGYVCYPGLSFAWSQRRSGLQRTAARARPLVDAIEKFRVENQRPPHDLQELVPHHLPNVPDTGMTLHPRFEYSMGSKGTHFQTYQLQIRTSAGFLNWDTFNYWPEGDYPAQMYGGRVERVGAWAYVHE